jgi:hypothetical protein
VGNVETIGDGRWMKIAWAARFTEILPVVAMWL